MSCDWPVVKTGDIFELINGYAFKSRDFTADGAAVLKIKNIKAGKLNLDNLAFVDTSFLSEKPDKIVLRDDLLITMSGNRHDGSMETWVGKVCWFGLSTNYLINQRVGILRLKKNINANPRFLAYQLSSTEFQHHFIAVATSSGGQANLSPTQIKSTELFLPPRQTQDRVAKILGELEDKIKVSEQINQTLEQIAQAIFKSWFVDFEPVKAKISAIAAGGSKEDALFAAMQAISGKDKAQLTQLQTANPEHYNQLRTTAELFPSAMQDSELGEIPEGWSSSDIGKEVTVVGGATPSTKNPEFWDDGDIAWTSPRDLSSLTDKILIDTERKITKAGLAKISSGLLPVNTVLMSSRAPVGYLALTKLPVAVNQGYIAMKCEKVLSPEFTLQWCSAHMDEIKNRASGTTFAEISKKNFKVIPVAVPRKEVIDAFSRQVRPLYSKIEINIRESDSLGLIRDSLLPKLLSGSLEAHNNDVEND